MTDQPTNGINRQGLDSSFLTEESRKSRLILEGRMLTAQQQFDGAARRFAEAAEIEDQLAEICVRQGLKDKSWIHRFSSASLWPWLATSIKQSAWASNYSRSRTSCLPCGSAFRSTPKRFSSGASSGLPAWP